MPIPTTGLVQYLRGDLDLTVALTRASAWGDQSALGQDMQQPNATLFPYVLGDDIDGIPLLTFGTAGDANKSLLTAANFTDRSSVDMDGAHARTVMVVCKPAFDAAWGVIGGKPWSIDNSWCPMFEFRSTYVTDGAYAWERLIDDYSNALQFTPVTGGSGGTYDGLPVLVEWSSSGGTNLSFRINNVPTTLSPSVLYGSSSGVGPASLSDNSLAFLGGIAAVLVWDYDLSSDATAHGDAISALAVLFPSLGLPTSPLAISPGAVTLTPNGRANFAASGGVPPYTYSISTSRSGGSINASNGAYLAGPAGLSGDVVRVTDSAFATADADVTIGAGLWQRTQQLVQPPFLRLPNAQDIVGRYGAEKDVEFERTRQGVLSSMPLYGPADALDLQGQERKLPRAVDIDGVAVETDDDYRTRLDVAWDDSSGWTPAGSFGAMLRAMDRGGFPMGVPDGAFIVQRYKRYGWLTASGGIPVYGTHATWSPDASGPEKWNQFSIVFGADVPELTDGSDATKRLFEIVDEWRPRKALFMGVWIIVSGPTWGWPPGVEWGDALRDWGGGSTRYLAPA